MSSSENRAGVRRPQSRRMPRWRVLLILAVFLGLLAVEYLVVPRLVGATQDLQLLTRLNTAWLVTAVCLEAASLWCYGGLMRTLLPAPTAALLLSTVFRITLACTSAGHLIPGGGAAVGYQLLSERGVASADAVAMLASAALGSALVLNALLWVALLVSIPLAGVHTAYVVIALIGLVAIVIVGFILYAFTRGDEHVVRLVRAVGRHLPHVGADRLEHAVNQFADSVRQLAQRKDVRGPGVAWAAGNWLLDAAALWAFLAALGQHVEPFELFAAYGIGNVVSALPVLPGGLGVVEASTASLLVSFGVTRSVATFGVLGWRLINFWLPIPVGALSYLSLRWRQIRQRR